MALQHLLLLCRQLRRCCPKSISELALPRVDSLQLLVKRRDVLHPQRAVPADEPLALQVELPPGHARELALLEQVLLEEVGVEFPLDRSEIEVLLLCDLFLDGSALLEQGPPQQNQFLVEACRQLIGDCAGVLGRRGELPLKRIAPVLFFAPAPYIPGGLKLLQFEFSLHALPDERVIVPAELTL